MSLLCGSTVLKALHVFTHLIQLSYEVSAIIVTPLQMMNLRHRGIT